VIEIALHEGRYRQVRRMLEAAGLRVHRLHRWAYGPLKLGSLPRGESRPLTAEEVSQLRAASARPRPRPAVVRSRPRVARGQSVDATRRERAPREFRGVALPGLPPPPVPPARGRPAPPRSRPAPAPAPEPPRWGAEPGSPRDAGGYGAAERFRPERRRGGERSGRGGPARGRPGRGGPARGRPERGGPARGRPERGGPARGRWGPGRTLLRRRDDDRPGRGSRERTESGRGRSERIRPAWMGPRDRMDRGRPGRARSGAGAGGFEGSRTEGRAVDPRRPYRGPREPAAGSRPGARDRRGPEGRLGPARGDGKGRPPGPGASRGPRVGAPPWPGPRGRRSGTGQPPLRPARGGPARPRRGPR
jgi:23S rRNA pseudouridine2605 synthase